MPEKEKKMTQTTDTFPPHDIDILRSLAETIAEIAESPENKGKKELWYKFDNGTADRPMVLAEAFGVVDPNSPLAGLGYQCKDMSALAVEGIMRHQIYLSQVLRDDHVVEPYYDVPWVIYTSDYGVQPIEHKTENNGRMTSKKWDPPIKDLDADFHKLHPRTFEVDRETTFAQKEKLHRVFGDILPIRIRNMFAGFQWTMGMTMTAMMLHGLENLMYSVIDNPDGLRRLMKFLCEDHLAYANWLEKEGLLTLNNENDYIGSGSLGYTQELPRFEKQGKTPVRLEDVWVLLESQETVGIGPKQFEEIFFPYQLRLAEKFGKCYYGCCEPVEKRWHIIKKIPNLSRVSVSPWADQKFLAEALGKNIVFSRKPSPTLISTEHFCQDAIEKDIRDTIAIARDCRLEIVMKDVHTLNNEPDRLPKWVDIARKVIDEEY
jgi:hypothetical protein